MCWAYDFVYTTVSQNIPHPFLSLTPEMSSWPGLANQRCCHFPAIVTCLGMDIWIRPGQLFPRSFAKIISKEMPSFLWDNGLGTCYNPRAALNHLSFFRENEATPRKREMRFRVLFEHLVQPLEAKWTPWTSQLLHTINFLYWWNSF